jgi:hypothetical protein
VHVESRQQGTAGFAGSMQLDLGNVRLVDAAAEAAVEVTRLDRRAVAGSEDQAGLDPGIPRLFPVGVLLFLAELERRDA